MQHWDDTFALLPEAQQIATWLVEDLDDFAHLRAARIAVIGSQRAVFLHGAPCAAFIGVPKVQGPCRLLFEWLVAGLCAPLYDGEDPDYLVMVDAAIWSGLDADGRERLMFHELSHVVQQTDENDVPKRHRDGTPLLKLVPHSYELFDEEIRRYGIATCQAEGLAHAIVDGDARKKRRGLKLA